MKQRLSRSRFVLVQLLLPAVAVVAVAASSRETRQELVTAATGRPPHPVVHVTRNAPLQISPLYNEPELVSDADLAAVLRQVQPRFTRERLRPNLVEHALRTWHIDASFHDPAVMSGTAMRDFLTDHGRFLASWGEQTDPLLEDRPRGVAIRWGSETGASVHHDHWLACLTEAGITRDYPIYTPSRQMTIDDALQEALRDFRLDEREVEWSAMAFGLWIPPVKSWKTDDGRELSFDRLAERLMRGDRRFGVCVGTHRIYSLMVLIRLDDEFDILSDDVRAAAWSHLENVRDLITASQYEDGRWPADWSRGAAALERPNAQEEFEQVIATGHHLEWLAIAPQELHPPREQIARAMRWIIDTTLGRTQEQILQHYTFFSHVGNALALWRGTTAADFWRDWERQHPYEPASDETAAAP